MYSCGQLLNQNQNGRLCSRFTVVELPKDDFAKNLKKTVEQSGVGVDGDFTYCRCKGQLCNNKKTSSIQCYSTVIEDEKRQLLHSVSKLHIKDYFSDKNLVSCPNNVTQCYRYSKIIKYSFVLTLAILQIPHFLN